MRVPLLHTDFEFGSFTKIAKALRKIWPLGEQSLMQAQNTLAVLLGYNGLHDAQREATASFSIPDGSLSMEKVANAVAWRMFVRYSIDLLSGQALVSSLHLHELGAARNISLEEMMRHAVGDGTKFLIRDEEFWDYMQHREPWPEQTPNLLGRGIPPYQWAIYPNRSVFLWSKLVAQIEMLPDEFEDDLLHAGKLRNDPDAVISFMVDSLVPAACRPLADALASGDLTGLVRDQLQWQVKWIVTQQAEILGCCIVAKKLGGMLPQVFASENDAYAALADLLCGGVVSPAAISETGTRVSEPAWLIDRDRLQHHLRHMNDADVLESEGLGSQWYYNPWPNTIELYQTREGYRLIGRAQFSERGQVYLATYTFDALEQQRMLREPIFETFDVSTNLLEESGSEAGIPALGNRWHDAVERMFSSRRSDVEAAMGTPAGVGTLRNAVTAIVSPADLEIFVGRAINECLPLRYEVDPEDNDILMSERRSAVDLTERLGKTVTASLPGLQAYSLLALGYMVLVANGEYPGSRYQGMADAPAPADWAGQSRLLAAMLVFENLSEREMARKALSCAIAPVLGLGIGEWSKEKISAWYESAHAVERHLKEAADQIKHVDEWREIEAKEERLRVHGDFLRAGDPIPVVKPKSAAEGLTEPYSMSRSSGFSVFHAKQDISSMKKALS